MEIETAPENVLPEAEAAGAAENASRAECSTSGSAVAGAGMRITCSRDELVGRLGIVSRAVSARGTVQVLSGILLSAEAGVLSLAATDMELSLRTTLEAEVEGEGAVVIPGKLLVDLARLLPESKVTIEYRPEEGVAQVASGSATYRLNTYSAEDFPRLPPVEAQLHAIDREALLETVDRVARSASRDESRPVLTRVGCMPAAFGFPRATIQASSRNSSRKGTGTSCEKRAYAFSGSLVSSSTPAPCAIAVSSTG